MMHFRIIFLTGVAAAVMVFSAGHARSMDMKVLEAGDFSDVARLRGEALKKNQPAAAAYYDGLGAFYRGDLKAAEEFLRNAGLPEAGWMRDYIRGVEPILGPMESRESEHFILRVPAKDIFLAPYAFDALEKAYRELGADFGLYPKDKVIVEIYPTRETFSAASTLSMEILERSGAVGICKFRRLMLVSPEQLAFGYRWLDTLSHEYAHYLINLKSRGQCPLWLHEGIAKYIETRWRRKDPDYLTPGNRTELARALKENKLIPFARMEPSMVYLKDQEEVRLAFSQVSHAAGAIEKIQGREAIMKILAALAGGKSRSEAFQEVLGMNDQAFETKWKEILGVENLQESPGAAPDVIVAAGKENEVDDLVPSEVRVHLRLGERMQKAGENRAALIQYEKALAREPNNPVALVRAARLCLTLEDRVRAVGYLERCAKENPNYPTGFVLLGREKVRLGQWEEARSRFEAANALNPFNPAVHEQLAQIYQKLGQSELSDREAAALAALQRP